VRRLFDPHTGARCNARAPQSSSLFNGRCAGIGPPGVNTGVTDLKFVMAVRKVRYDRTDLSGGPSTIRGTSKRSVVFSA